MKNDSNFHLYQNYCRNYSYKVFKLLNIARSFQNNSLSINKSFFS